MSDIFELFANTTDLQEAIAMLQTGIQDEQKLDLRVSDFHKDLQELFLLLGMRKDTIVLSSVLTKTGNPYVNTPAITKVSFKKKPEPILILQTPNFFTPFNKAREKLSQEDQQWEGHTLVITLESDATCRVPMYTTYKTKEERDKVSAGSIVRGNLENVKDPYFTFVSEEPTKNAELTSVDDVFALADGKSGMGFVKVGSAFTQMADLPNGDYKVIRVSQTRETRKKDGNPFISKKMDLMNSSGAIIETNAPRPISQILYNDSVIPDARSADPDTYFYKVTIADGKIIKTERDVEQLKKALIRSNLVSTKTEDVMDEIGDLEDDDIDL